MKEKCEFTESEMELEYKRGYSNGIIHISERLLDEAAAFFRNDYNKEADVIRNLSKKFKKDAT